MWGPIPLGRRERNGPAGGKLPVLNEEGREQRDQWPDLIDGARERAWRPSCISAPARVDEGEEDDRDDGKALPGRRQRVGTLNPEPGRSTIRILSGRIILRETCKRHALYTNGTGRRLGVSGATAGETPTGD